MRARPAAAFLAATLLATTPAFGQTWSERVYVSVNGAFQSQANDFSDRYEFDLNQERGSTASDYPVKSGFIFDGGAGVRLFKNVGAGVAVSYFTRDDAASTSSRFPHPFQFNSPREVTADVEGLNRTERAVHVQAMYLWNPAGPLRVVFSGGPSFFNVEQDLVTDVRISASYPYDTADFSSATTQRIKASTVGFNAGADVTWMVARNVGVGGLIRFARTSVDLDAPGNRVVPIDAGGVYAGGGLRVVFD